MDSQIIGAFTIIALAWFGISFDVPEWIPLVAAAVTGSLQAAAIRIRRGYVKGFGSAVWAIIAGLSAGLLIGPSIAAIAGLEVSTGAAVLPVYIFALLGGRLILWLSTDVDVHKIGNAGVDAGVSWFKRKSDK